MSAAIASLMAVELPDDRRVVLAHRTRGVRMWHTVMRHGSRRAVSILRERSLYKRSWGAMRMNIRNDVSLKPSGGGSAWLVYKCFLHDLLDDRVSSLEKRTTNRLSVEICSI